MEDMPFGLGALPSKEDPHTIKSTDVTLASAPPLTYKIDYTGLPHKHQHKVGICTAACVASLAEKFFGDGVILSMEWLYKMGKVLVDGNIDEGSSIFTMLKAAQKYGIPSEAKFPSNTERTYAEFIADTNITQAMLDDAALHKIPGYVQVPVNATDLMNALYASPCGLATREAVGNELWTDVNGNVTWDKAKLEPWRTTLNVISGHAIGMISYDATADFEGVKRNSWGEEWCDNGDISFYLKTRAPFFTEAWSIIGKVLFVHDLWLGVTSPDVQRLQKFLNTNGFPVALSGMGSSGNESTFYGPKTFLAVRNFQKANGILGTGYFGPITRAKINSLP